MTLSPVTTATITRRQGALPTSPRLASTKVCALAALLTLAFGVCLASPAHATEVGSSRPFGLGVAIGTPTSIVGKVFTSNENAVDFGLGFWRTGARCWGGNPHRYSYCDAGYGFTSLSINADYLWQEDIVRGTGAELDWHIGAGGRVWLFDDYDSGFAVAGRMPIGLDLTFPKPNFLEVFLELAPALYVVPGIGLDIEAFLGVRFYF